MPEAANKAPTSSPSAASISAMPFTQTAAVVRLSIPRSSAAPVALSANRLAAPATDMPGVHRLSSEHTMELRDLPLERDEGGEEQREAEWKDKCWLTVEGESVPAAADTDICVV